MDRKLYLNLCRDYAVGKQPTVVFDGIKYYPAKYELGFAKDGSVIHTAILRDIKAKAWVYAPLDKVEVDNGQN